MNRVTHRISLFLSEGNYCSASAPFTDLRPSHGQIIWRFEIARLITHFLPLFQW